MAEKRLFEFLDIMNQNDDKNKTATAGCCFSFVGAQTTKQGGTVTMGVPAQVVKDLLLEKNKKAMLVIIDIDEYNRIKAEE